MSHSLSSRLDWSISEKEINELNISFLFSLFENAPRLSIEWQLGVRGTTNKPLDGENEVCL